MRRALALLTHLTRDERTERLREAQQRRQREAHELHTRAAAVWGPEARAPARVQTTKELKAAPSC